MRNLHYNKEQDGETVRSALKSLQFKELAQRTELQQDTLIQEIIQNFPKEPTLIGLIKDNRIIIIEGMHRCIALTVAQSSGIEITSDMSIILAEFNAELPLLGQLTSPT